MTTRRKVLITGATGTVGQVLYHGLKDEYDLVLQGRHPKTPEMEKLIVKVDTSSYEDTLGLMEGVDTVIHLAGASKPESTWDDVLEANIIGFRNVLEAAREKGVRRFIFASSNHAMGMYDRHNEWPVYPTTLPRGDSFYGVSKIFGEALGRFYHDEYGIDFISLRIGWVSGDPMLSDVDLLHAMWLSEDDCVQVHRCAIEADVTWGLYYAISNNLNRRWDMTNTLLELGYRPKDSWTQFTDGKEDVVLGGAKTPEDWPANS